MANRNLLEQTKAIVFVVLFSAVAVGGQLNAISDFPRETCVCNNLFGTGKLQPRLQYVYIHQFVYNTLWRFLHTIR